MPVPDSPFALNPAFGFFVGATWSLPSGNDLSDISKGQRWRGAQSMFFCVGPTDAE
jgi:hypothetical protein